MDRKKYTAEDGTTFDTSYRDEDVELYVAGDNTIIARPREADPEEGGDSEDD